MKRLLALCVLLALAAGAPAHAEPAPRSITVSGESSEQAAPDQAVLSVSLVSKDKELSAAKKQNDAMTEKLVAITRKFEIPKEKISTSNLYIAPEYRYDNATGQQQFMGYTVSRSLRITMDATDVHEKLLSALVDAKIDQINGVQFLLANPQARAAALRVKAFEDAKAKAAALAQAAGGKLGPALTISTTGDSTAIPQPPRPMMKAMMAEAAPSVAPSLPGMVELQEAVTVTFALE